jgi:Peptidase family M28
MPRRPSLALPILAAAALTLATARCRDATSPGNAGRASTITASEMRLWIYRLADDSMMGRGTPSPELDEAAATIAAYFARLGLRPAFADQRYVARYPAPPAGGTPDSAPNVAGILPGSDARLAGQYVVLVAHVDGLGVLDSPTGDTIYNGADDNASGTAGVLELADAFVGTDPHPRRSLLFLLVSGEEQKYWGSQWYVDHPSVPIDSIIAVFNLDMISRNTPDSLLISGLPYSTMAYTFSAAFDAHPELGFRVYSPGPQSGSDFVPFWAAGVPFLHFFTGLHHDYHRTTDDPELVDPDKAARVTRLAFYTALMVANADGRPQWLTSAAPPAAAWERPR